MKKLIEMAVILTCQLVLVDSLLVAEKSFLIVHTHGVFWHFLATSNSLELLQVNHLGSTATKSKQSKSVKYAT